MPRKIMNEHTLHKNSKLNLLRFPRCFHYTLCYNSPEAHRTTAIYARNAHPKLFGEINFVREKNFANIDSGYLSRYKIWVKETLYFTFNVCFALQRRKYSKPNRAVASLFFVL